MKSPFPLFAFVAALSLVACQGGDGPVAEGATAPPDQIVGDKGMSGLDSPTSSRAAEAVDRAAMPIAANGMRWASVDGGTGATYGPTGAKPMLGLSCGGQGKARQLVVTRFHPAHAGKTGTLSLTGGGHASSLPMYAVAKPGGPGESEWRGEVSGDMARAVARAFSGKGLVDVTLGGAPALSIPSSPVATAVLTRCS